MPKVLEPTQDPGWVLHHEGYSVQNESAVESRFALGNGFLGARAARSVSRGRTWVSWLGYIKWASWPRCYVAGLFDIPNTGPRYRRWCRSPTGRGCGLCWTRNRNCCGMAS